MRRALITGARGTVGRVLNKHLQGRGVETVPWDRELVPIQNYDAMEHFVKQTQADAVFHLATASQLSGADNESWMVNYDWTSELAWLTRLMNIPFVFTSSVMVFSDLAKGPFTPQSEPDAVEGIGFEKRMAEERVFYQNPHAIVARLGWQIGSEPGTNHMLTFFDRKMSEEGIVKASRRWLPACSFLEDTATALTDLAEQGEGLYHLDSNRQWSFYDIASALNNLHGNRWVMEPNEDFEFDQRMQDNRFKMPGLNQRLSLP